MAGMMAMGQVVYSSGSVQDTDGEISIGQHTIGIHFSNRSAIWVEIKLNGGPHSVWLPPEDNQSHSYLCVPGDYPKFQVMTSGGELAVFAIG